jgi:hypothetical protein
MNKQSKKSLKTRFRTVTALAAAAMILCGARVATADDVQFEFYIPRMPQTPIIKDIVNSSVGVNGTMTVYATIEGRPQTKACCGVDCDRTDCDMAQWYLIEDPSIFPNPPCIPNPNGTGSCLKQGNPKLYYYINEVAALEPPVTMSYNSSTGKFEGEISLAGTVNGDIITYYIVASDSRGNVTSQLPSAENTSCGSVTSWNANYQTPATNNCAQTSSYERCSINQPGAPTCGTSYTINDPVGDTCGAPDENGNQSLVSGWQTVDTHGFSASAGKGFGDLPGEDVVCVKARLGGQPFDRGLGSIGTYLLTFFNPDISDPNPADMYFPNSFIVLFMPELDYIDPSPLVVDFDNSLDVAFETELGVMNSPLSNRNRDLVVLWDGNCVTNPNTPDPLDCSLIIGSDMEKRLQAKYVNDENELRFIVKNSLPNGKTIIGSTSKSTRMVFLTGKIQLSGGAPFYVVDMTPALEMVKNNRQFDPCPCCVFHAPPIIKSTACKSGGQGSTSTCVKQGAAPPAEGNNCVFEVLPSPDRSFTNYYNIYYNTVNDKSTAALVESLSGPVNFPENGASLYTKTFNIPVSELNGHPRYFYFSSVNATAPPSQQETVQANWTSAVCTPEDWEPPLPPEDLSCATPKGSDGECRCEWTADKVSDPSLYGFDIRRDGVQMNTNTVLTDFHIQSGLVNMTPYSYQIRAVDVGGNKSAWSAPSVCVPYDLKPPAKVKPSVVLQIGKFGVNVNWEPGSESDLAGGGGYNVYYCHKVTPSSCGADSEGLPAGYSKSNSFLIAQPAVLNPMSYSNDSAFGNEPAEWCFWVEACDNCKIAGTCPENQSANCGSFDTSFRHRKCLTISDVAPETAPAWPENQTATAVSEGRSCTIEWAKVCADDEGNIFANCDYPTPYELLGYKIMRAPAVSGGCAQTPSPSTGTPIRTVLAGDPTSYTDSGAILAGGQPYCYRVYAYNVFDLHSRMIPAPATSGPVVCMPTEDPIPPNKPIMTQPVEFNANSCSPSWSEVSDKNSATYDVHRCTGDLSTCNSAAKFSKITTSSITALYHMDESVTTDTEYVYCATAIDPIGNASSVYAASDLSNCGYCFPSEKCMPPTAVEAFEIAPIYYGARAGWTNSSDDDGMGAGYHVYLCANSNPASCLAPYGRLTSSGAVPGAHDRQLGQDPLPFYNIPVALSGDYYIGVSYTGASCGESQIAVSSSPVRLETRDACSIDPKACPVSFEFNKPFTRYEIQTCSAGTTGCLVAAGAATGFRKVETPLPGVRVEVVEAATKTVVKSSQTDISGNIPLFKMRTGICSECVDASKQYVVRAVFPEGTWEPGMSAMMGCAADSEPGECAVTLKPAGSLSATAATSVAPAAVPLGASGGGGDIGNPTCRPTVHIANLQPLRHRFGSFAGDALYHPAADFNMDGKVSMQDLDVFKKNYGKTVPVSSSTLLCDPLFDAR